MKVLDLFSGIGGFSLGLERAGMETIAFCESEPHAQKILKKHWPKVKQYNDIKTLIDDYDQEKPDVICGGFPCQPFSSASHGKITAEDLWPYMAGVIWRLMPRFVIAENVSEKAINQVKADLEILNYECITRKISAHNCGGWHRRNRYWVIAYSNKDSKLHSAIDAEAQKLPQLCKNLWSGENYAISLRVSDGVSNRVDRLARLGNSIIPQIPEAIGRAIMEQNNG